MGEDVSVWKKVFQFWNKLNTVADPGGAEGAMPPPPAL